MPQLKLGALMGSKNSERRVMNNTMNRLQINQLLTKSGNFNLTHQSAVKKEPHTQRDIIREGELSEQSHSQEKRQGKASIQPRKRSTRYQSRESEIISSHGSNCTQEKNFTPGQKQFKTFLNQQTGERDLMRVKRSNANVTADKGEPQAAKSNLLA